MVLLLITSNSKYKWQISLFSSKYSLRYRHLNNYTQKWLKKIVILISFHKRTEIYLVQEGKYKTSRRNIYIHKSKYIREKKKKKKDYEADKREMTSGLKMICLIRIYTSYRIQLSGAGVGSNGDEA